MSRAGLFERVRFRDHDVFFRHLRELAVVVTNALEIALAQILDVDQAIALSFGGIAGFVTGGPGSCRTELGTTVGLMATARCRGTLRARTNRRSRESARERHGPALHPGSAWARVSELRVPHPATPHTREGH